MKPYSLTYEESLRKLTDWHAILQRCVSGLEQGAGQLGFVSSRLGVHTWLGLEQSSTPKPVIRAVHVSVSMLGNAFSWIYEPLKRPF